MHRVAAALACVSVLALIAASSERARADEPYPSKPIRLVLPQPAGGAVDLIARSLGDRLSYAMRQPVIVENQPGANGGLAAGQVARAAPDGYTLFMAVDTNLVVNPNLYPNLAYDPFRDFIPISIIAKVYLVLVASSKVEANSVQELLAFARAHPGKLNYASIGLGTQAHLGMELLKMMTKTDITQVSYRGTAPAMTDIAAGVVDVMFTGPPSAMALAAGGKGKMLAVASPSRLSLMPQVPTMQEAGVPGYELSGWSGAGQDAAACRRPARQRGQERGRRWETQGSPGRARLGRVRKLVRGDACGDDGGHQEMERGHRRDRRQSPAMIPQ
jgi:tripartite-type tricarboxylate transporter receptor subunit TctC